MAGIFPSGGTEPNNTMGAQIGLKLVALCKALFYRTNCNPRFDPVASNAQISELANAINLIRNYDCNRLDNLALVLKAIQDGSTLETLEPDMNDLLRGTFDNVAGRATIQSVLGLSPIADPTATTITNLDYVGFYNAEEARNEKIRFDAFKQQVAPDLALGYTGDDKNNKEFPMWSTLFVYVGDGGDWAGAVRNQIYPIYLVPEGSGNDGAFGDCCYTITNYGTGSEYRLNGKWAARGSAGQTTDTNNDQMALFQRIP